MTSLRLLQSLPTLSSFSTLVFLKNPLHVPPTTTYLPTKKFLPITKRLVVTHLALTESSDSPQSLDPSPQLLLERLADAFDLPPDYLNQLPGDLRLDLNDAAFDLSNGPVIDECGPELGELLLNLSKAWELADTSTSLSLASKQASQAGEQFDRKCQVRLLSAGRRFQSMGQYGQGELQEIAQALIETGKLLSASSVPKATDTEPKKEVKVFKFGELQVALTPQKANIGATIGVAFGILSWELTQGIQSIPESSLQYANDNALLLAKSLRGALLAVFYFSTFLSAYTSVGLFLYGRQLESEEKYGVGETKNNITYSLWS